MKFKKVDILISENLTKEQLKVKVLQELNKVAQNDGYDALSIHYIANIHDIRNGKYWICMDTETKKIIFEVDRNSIYLQGTGFFYFISGSEFMRA